MGKLKLNLSYILKTSWFISSGILTGITVLLSFFSWEDMHIKNSFVKASIIISVFFMVFLIDMVFVLFIIKNKKVWKKGNNEVKAMYSDLFKIAFDSYTSKRIIVIPFNDTFDTIVEEPGEGVTKPLVSPNTNHGRWINRFLKEEGIDQSTLNDRIQKDLSARNIKNTKSLDNREKGNRIKYPLGTVAVINGKKNCIFYLLAMSSYDENNTAHASKKEIRDSLDELLSFYDSNAQSVPMYLPLMGTGSSRSGLTHEQSLRLIKSTVLTSDKPINGEINIVVYYKDKDKVSIFK